MRKKAPNAPPRTSRQVTRTLRLSKETVRTLTEDDLSNVASGCPDMSWTVNMTTTLQQDTQK
jgi:DNA polymerase III psi subunit